MVAAAAILTERRLPVRKMDNWQEEAWSFYDTVGELRYGVTYLSNAMSRCRLVAAQPGTPDNPEPQPLADGPAVEAMARLAGGAVGQAQLLAGFGVVLSVPGIGYLVGEPTPEGETWVVFAPDVIRSTPGIEGVGYQVQTDDTKWRDLDPEALVVQCWRPNRRRLWEPDSSVRAVLGVLREIQLLDERIVADATSRLAGAGIIVIPSEAEFPKRRPDDPDEDPFTEQLLEAMTVPIKQRDSAAAVVPLAVRVPAEFAAAVRHVKLATDFDAKILELRESAIKRLAVGLDLPPEAVLGVADVNHWTAWQVEESAIKMHVEPSMEVVCDALTVGYLRPALTAVGADPDTALVWYDPAALRVRPDRSQTSIALYDRAELSGDATRREVGFDGADRPSEDELRRQVVLHTAMTNPAQLPTVMAALDTVLTGAPDPAAAPLPDGATPPAPGPGGRGGGGRTPPSGSPSGRVQAPSGPPAAGPPTGPSAPPVAPVAASARRHSPFPDALMAACDGLVDRALEHAGNRLRTRAGMRGDDGCPPAIAHTCVPVGTLDKVGLDAVLAGAWIRVPEVAVRYRVEPEGLRRALDGYARSLLASGTPHNYATMCEAFGYQAA